MKKLSRVLFFSGLIFLSPIMAYAGWMKTYGGSGVDHGSCVRATNDGGYIIIGSTTSFGPAPSNLWLVRLDSLGDTIWMHAYDRGLSMSLSSIGSCVCEIPEGGYIGAGMVMSIGIVGGSGENIVWGNEQVALWLIKVNSSGKLVWERTHKGKAAGFANYLCMTSDGNYLAVGATVDTSFKKDKTMPYMVKSTIRGDKVWEVSLIKDTSFIVNFVKENNDKGLILCGTAGKDALLMKTDSLGNPLWARTLGGKKGDSLFELCETKDGGFMIVGNTSSWGAGKCDLWLVRTDSLGDTLWTKTYGGERNDAGSSVVATTDGGAIIAGYTESEGEGRKDAWLIKVDANGNKTWSKTFGTWQDEEAQSVDITKDGGYIITGYCTKKGSEDLWVIKTDSKGNVD